MRLSKYSFLPGTSKKASMGLLRRHQAKPMAGAANSKAAPAATPPAIAPVLVDPGLFAASKECQLVNFTMREVQIISSQKLREI
jgi:hypothetical protein